MPLRYVTQNNVLEPFPMMWGHLLLMGLAPAKPSLALVALGCPKNTVDAEVMLGHMQKNGYRIVAKPRHADVIVVNTCAFVEDAKKESIAAVVQAAELKMQRQTKPRALFVTGCLAQRYAQELADELPEVDAVIGFEGYADLPSRITRALGEEKGPHTSAQQIVVGSPTVPFREEDDRWLLTPKHSAYVRVAEGCDHNCAFCAIPGFRGTFRSKPFEVLVAEATRLVEGGARELNLIAEDTNQYGSDWGDQDSRRLPELLRVLSGISQLKWIRLLYCYPSYFSEELIDEIANNDKVVKYIDIPLQHLHGDVLRRMRRPGEVTTLALLRKLRERIPSLVLRTTFISGFPGETREEHTTLMQRVRELGFERGGAFAYSREDGTDAANMISQVDEATKSRRRDELSALFEDRITKFATSLVGKTVRVMIDRMEDTDAVGRTEFDAPEIDREIRINGMPLAPGSVLVARVVAVDSMGDLVAEPVLL